MDNLIPLLLMWISGAFFGYGLSEKLLNKKKRDNCYSSSDDPLPISTIEGDDSPR